MCIGKNPPDYPEGPYPTYITQSSGKVVPVVQAGSYSKYVGYLQLEFDENGQLLKPVETKGVKMGQPYLLDSKVEQSPQVLAAMKPFQDKLKSYKKIVGKTLINLERDREPENNLGDLVSDAFRSFSDDIDLSFVNNGGLRSPISKVNFFFPFQF